MNNYQLIELLSRDPLFEVYKAKSLGVEGFEKTLEIKKISPELNHNSEFVAAFLDEAKTTVNLCHANIVQVFDMGYAHDSYFIATEHLSGNTLDHVLRASKERAQRIPAELGVYIISEVARGLDYAHRHRDSEMQPLNIIHRDISPSNVFLSHDGQVKVANFGIAKACSHLKGALDRATIEGGSVGAYLSPEQIQDDGLLDQRTDLFSLGVLLYEVILGHNPFRQTAGGQTAATVFDAAYVALCEMNPEVPSALTDIDVRSMNFERERRYPSAAAMHEDLAQLVEHGMGHSGASELSAFMKQFERVEAPKVS
ncbi:MAG: serine/threonine-protein kinase [Myxococcota bacterium]